MARDNEFADAEIRRAKGIYGFSIQLSARGALG